MTVPVGNLWSGGILWAPSEHDGVWTAPDEAGPDALDPPQLAIAIGGYLVLEQLQAAGWDNGRAGWFSQLQPSSCSLSFWGIVQADPGQLIVISSGLDVHWVGYADDVLDDEVPGGQLTSQVNGTDQVGRLGGAQLVDVDVPAGTLADLVVWLADRAGLAVSVTIAPSVGTLPTLDATSGFTGSVLEYLTRAEASSNALLFLNPDGTFSILVRDALPTTDPTVYDLSGEDSPGHWQRRRSPQDIRNAWQLTKGDGTVVLDVQDDASVQAYGQRAYSVSGYLSSSAAHFSSGLRTAAAVIRSILAEATFKVLQNRHPARTWRPLDWVSRDDDQWQLVSLKHDVRPTRLTDAGSIEALTIPDWTVTVQADQTQNAIVDEPEPPAPEEPEEPAEPDTYLYVMTTIHVDRDCVAARTPGGDYYGSGKGDTLPVGKWDGWKFRAFLRWDGISWPSDTIEVTKAILSIRTADQTEVAFGSSPQVIFQATTSSFSEGTEGADGNYHFDNATVWPGPGRTGSGQLVKTVTRSENTTITANIRDIVQRWFEHGNTGLAIISSNEDSTSRTTEFQSREGGFDAELSITVRRPV